MPYVETSRQISTTMALWPLMHLFIDISTYIETIQEELECKMENQKSNHLKT